VSEHAGVPGGILFFTREGSPATACESTTQSLEKLRATVVGKRGRAEGHISFHSLDNTGDGVPELWRSIKNLSPGAHKAFDDLLREAYERGREAALKKRARP
jgi:hypothetical protein